MASKNVRLAVCPVCNQTCQLKLHRALVDKDILRLPDHEAYFDDRDELVATQDILKTRCKKKQCLGSRFFADDLPSRRHGGQIWYEVSREQKGRRLFHLDGTMHLEDGERYQG